MLSTTCPISIYKGGSHFSCWLHGMRYAVSYLYKGGSYLRCWLRGTWYAVNLRQNLLRHFTEIPILVGRGASLFLLDTMVAWRNINYCIEMSQQFCLGLRYAVRSELSIQGRKLFFSCWLCGTWYAVSYIYKGGSYFSCWLHGTLYAVSYLYKGGSYLRC